MEDNGFHTKLSKTWDNAKSALEKELWLCSHCHRMSDSRSISIKGGNTHITHSISVVKMMCFIRFIHFHFKCLTLRKTLEACIKVQPRVISQIGKIMICSRICGKTSKLFF